MVSILLQIPVRLVRRVSSLMVFAVILTTMGCEIDAVTVGSPRASVVVHAVLNPDATEQVILVESSLTGRVAIDSTLRFDPLDPIRTAGGEPLEGADVRLLVDNDSVGVPAVETIVSGKRTGRYTVARSLLAVMPSHTYRLRIATPDGRIVTGTTRVPSASGAWQPGVGSTALPLTMNRSRDTLRLTWTPTPDARAYVIRAETPNGPWFLFSDSSTFTLSGSQRNIFADGLPSVWYPGFVQPVTVIAVDVNYWDYNRSGNDPFGGTGLISSVQGGLGLFGSALPILRRDVTITDRDVAPIDARWLGETPGLPTLALDLWLESPGPSISSLSGRWAAQSGQVPADDVQFVVGTIEDDKVRLAVLAGLSKRDTMALFTGRLAGDSIVGDYSPQFAPLFQPPKVWRRSSRTGS